MSKIQKNQKILMINLPFSGHVNPTLPLAECLVKRGHSVDYICTEQFRQKIENTGASFIPYSSFPKDPTENEKKKLSFMAAFNTALEHKGEYDILIYEMFFYPGIKLAELLGIPCIRQFSQPAWSDESAKDMSPVFKLSSILIDAQVMGKKAIKDMNLSFKSMSDAIIHSKPDMNIVYVPESFQKCRESFDDTFFYAVPKQNISKSDVHIPYEMMKNPIIYISLGSIISDKSFYKKCIRAFADKDVSVILNTGKISPDALGAIPENFYAYSFVPQIEVLQNTSVFLTHCGMNSVNEAICAGVPMVAMPFVNDQIENAKQIDKLQIGRRIHSFPSRIKEIESSVFEVLSNPIYRDNVKKLQQEINLGNSWDVIIDRIEKLCY